MQELKQKPAFLVKDVSFKLLPFVVEKMPETLKGLKKNHIMLLVHSAATGQLVLTDAPGSLYDEFLKEAKKKLGN